jgi:hypothetical protein
MPTRIVTPEWRDQNGPNRYPFAEGASLVSRDGRVLLEGVLLDAAIYPVGGAVGLSLTAADVGASEVTLYVGNEGRERLCSGTFPVSRPGTTLELADANGRAAGMLLAAEAGLATVAAWGRGLHEFAPHAAEFVASVCVPTPEVGVRGVLLEDGTVMAGDVWILGDDGVVVTGAETLQASPVGGPPRHVNTIRVDVVGDPLFRRRLCEGSTFSTPRFVRALRLLGPDGEDFVVRPDGRGNIALTVSGADASDTVLRLTASQDGVTIGAAGRALGDA